jgi:hypothetical protein
VERIVRTFAGIRVDTTDWPLVLHEFPEDPVPDSVALEYHAYVEQLLREAHAAGDRHYHVIDVSRVREMPRASQRKSAADLTKRTAALSRAVGVGTAYVAPSAVMRALFTAIFWLVPPPTPNAFFATRREALRHAARALDAAGVPLPPRLLELGG